MSRVVSSLRFNLANRDPEAEHRARRGETKKTLVYGSKKMRNQANCSQYFTKPELSKSRNGTETSKSVIIDKERTRTLKKSVSRSVLLPSENEFYEKVHRQLTGKLAHAKERSPLMELARQNEYSDYVRSVRVVDDEMCRRSLGALAEEVSYVPKLLSREQSSHKRPALNTCQYEELPKTRPFDRFDSQDIKIKESLEQASKADTHKSSTACNFKSTPEEMRRSEANHYSSSAYDVRMPLGRHSLIRPSPSDVALNSSAGLMKKWDFIEDMEQKIDKALERSRSRSKLMDLSQGLGNYVSSSSVNQDSMKKTYPSKYYASKVNHSTKGSCLGYQRYAPMQKKDLTDGSKDNTKSAIDLREIEGGRSSVPELNPGDKSQLAKITSNSDNKLFQPRALHVKRSIDGGSSDADLFTSTHKEEASRKRKESISNIDKILNDIRPDFIHDYASESVNGVHKTRKSTQKLQEIDAGNFSSFKEYNLGQTTASNNNLHSREASRGYQTSPVHPTDRESNKGWRPSMDPMPVFDNMSSVSGINAKGDLFMIDGISTPSLIPGTRDSLDWSKGTGRKSDAVAKSGFGESKSSRHAIVELNSNFFKRFWSLRFTSSQELKVLVAESIIFIGDKKNGLKCGKGKFITERSGVVLYEGQFYDNLYHGQGKLFNPKVCETIEPEWYHNLDEVEAWVRYEGNFAGGLPEGPGALHMRNGDVLRGRFVRGRVTGQCTIYAASGAQKLSGEWADNILISSNS